MSIDVCRTTIKRTDCGGAVSNSTADVYTPFDVCLPFGRTLHYDGVGLRLTERVTVTDGTYGVFTVENGCITAAAEQPVCEYTAQPCTPAAAPCGDGGATSVTLQPGEDNLLNFDSAGRLGGQLIYEAGDNISIEGYGTASSPLKITYVASATESTVVKAGNNGVTVSGSGSGADPYYVSHADSAADAGTYNNITIDEYGHIIAISEESTGVSNILGGLGITVQNSGTIYTISLPTQSGAGTVFPLGGYNLDVNAQGIVTGASRTISLFAGESEQIDPRFNHLTLNSFGSVIGITPHAIAADDTFCELFTDPRDTTSLTFTTTKTAFFKINYTGLLPATASTAKGYYALPSPYRLLVDGRRTSAYCRYDSARTGITEIIAVTDAYYDAGDHTVQLYNSTTDSTFNDVGMLSVALVQRSSS